jgi:hypothetical protein
MAKNKPQASVRITNQFRKGQAMVYDLSCEDIRLTIEIVAHQNGDGPDEWTVEAHAREAPEKPTIHETSGTRVDALRAVARSWTAKQGLNGFPSLDWDAVSVALLAVRAI